MSKNAAKYLFKSLGVALFVSAAWAANNSALETGVENLKMMIGTDRVEFVRFPDRHLTLSKSCLKTDGSISCRAYTALKKAHGVPLKHSRGGGNPGAVICSQRMGGKVVVASDESGDQQSFCSFQDGSYVGSGSIAYAATHD